MMLVYSPEITPRITYIFRYLLEELSGLTVNFTADTEEFLGYSGVKICYHTEPLSDGIFFRSSGLLTEKGIKNLKPEYSEYKNIPALFPVNPEGSELPFDLFSAAFFMISRYEEYLPFLPDSFQRFPATESLSYRYGFLEKPVVNIWASMLQDILHKKHSGIKFSVPVFRFIPTIDVDTAFAFKGRNLYRTTGGFMRSLFQGRYDEMIQRILVLSGRIADPSDTYDFILKSHDKIKERTVFFFLSGDYGAFDKNIPVNKKIMSDLIQRLSHHHEIGIHPSMASNDSSQILASEINNLSRVLGKKITKSRQHFLRVHLPNTYRNLVTSGIEEDYSMGFADATGFRAGTCHPFSFYDLEREEVSALRIFPIAYMDGTFCDYMKITPDAALENINRLLSIYREFHGTFVSLWHNDSLNNINRWAGWQQIYLQMTESLTTKS